MLGRDPDSVGLNAYTQLLNNGTPASTIRQTLAYSQEAAGKLTTLYSDVNNNLAPTAAQIATYENALAGGTPLTTVITPLVTQAQGEIAGLYQQELGRTADAGGLASYMALVPTLALEGQTPIATIRASIAYSDEETGTLTALYTNVYGQAPTAQQIAAFESQIAAGTPLTTAEAPLFAQAGVDIQTLYQTVLGRPADNFGLTFYSGELESGTPLSTIRGTLASSDEANGAISNLYRQVLNRAPDQTGLSSYVQYLSTSKSLADVRATMATSGEAASDLAGAYQAAFGTAPSNAVVTFLEGELGAVTGLSANGTTLVSVEASLANALLTGTVANQAITTTSTDQPFAAVNVSDSVAGSLTATISLNSTTGTLSGNGLQHPSTSIYTLTSGSPAALSTTLDNLVFTPTGSSPATTSVNLSVTDASNNTGNATVQITTQTISTPNTPPNFIYSSLGDDAFTGTAGPDIFAYTGNGTTGNDTIANFDLTQDMLQLSAVRFADFAAVQAATTTTSGNSVIRIDATDSITLTGVTNLTSQNIRLV